MTRNKTSLLTMAAFILAVAMSGCSNRQTSESGPQQIEFKNLDTENAAALLDVEYFVMETTDEAVVGSIDCIQQSDTTVYISDYQSERIFAFSSKTGKFLKNIGQRGEGDGEYQSMYSFFIKGDTIGIYDANIQRITYYSIPDNSFIRHQDYKGFSGGVCMPAGNSLIWDNDTYEGENADSCFLVTGPDGNITAKLVTKEFKSWLKTGDRYKVYPFGSKVMGYTAFDTVVYELSADAATPQYNVTAEGFSFPDAAFLNKISNDGKDDYYKKLKDSGHISYYAFYETSDMLVLYFICDKEGYYGFYDKRDGKTAFLTKEKLIADLQLGDITFATAVSIDDSMALVIEPDDILTAHSNGAEVDSRLLDIARNAPKDSNPIIAMLRAKR